MAGAAPWISAGWGGPIDWAAVAAITAIVGMIGAAVKVLLDGHAARSRRLSLLASRQNEAMCSIEVIYDPQGQLFDAQLEVRGLWPRSLFLLPGGGGPLKTHPDGRQSIDGDWLSSKRHVRCRMGERHGRLFASTLVWSKRPFRSALLMLTVRDRASGKSLIARARIINPST